MLKLTWNKINKYIKFKIGFKNYISNYKYKYIDYI